jgi:hypothetical protein
VLVLGSEGGTALMAIPAGVLLLAGGAKLLLPAGASAGVADAGLPAWATRPLGGLEAAVGAVCLLHPSTLSLAAMAVLYGGFAIWTSVRLARGRRGGCGCLWGDEQLDGVHVAVDVGLAAISVAAALRPPPSLPAVIGADPMLAVPLLASLCCGVYCVTLVMRHLSESFAAYRPVRGPSQ